MQSDKKINLLKKKYILKKYVDLFSALEEYDRTRVLPFQRKKLYITLSVSTLKKLNELKQSTGKSISRIIEERIN